MIQKAGDIVVKGLLDSIIKGELKPGDKLPSLENLAKMNNTSVLSVREAVQSLSVIGVLDVLHGRGIFLTGGAPIIEELIEARRTLECYFAAAAAQHCSAEILAEMESQIIKMERSMQDMDLDSFSEIDLDFHYSIGKAAGNRILFKTLENIRKLLRYQLFALNRLPASVERSAFRHREIFDAIKRKDADAAKNLMWQHITESIDKWKQYLAVRASGSQLL